MAEPISPPVSGAGVWTVRVIGLFVVTCVVAVGALGLVAGFFQQREVLRTTPTEAVTKIVVDVEAGDVTLTAAPAGGRAEVTRTVRWAFGRPTTEVSVQDGVLTVNGRCSGSFILADSCAVDLAVFVPTGVPVEVTSTSGDVVLRELTGPLAVHTTGGDIVASGLRSDTATLASTVGDISTSFVTAPSSLVVATTTGDVAVRLPASAGPYTVTGRSTLGDRTVTVPQQAGAGHRVDVTTTVGDVQVEPAT